MFVQSYFTHRIIYFQIFVYFVNILISDISFRIVVFVDIIFEAGKRREKIISRSHK